MLKNLIALPYEIARKPVVAVQDKLSDRLPETAGPRVALDRALGSADRMAGSVLRNRDIAERGAERLRRSDTSRAAARLEEEAAIRREEARETAAGGREEAARQRNAAQRHAAEGLDEADAAETRGKAEATARAAKTASAKKAAADRKAEARTGQAQQRKQQAARTAESKQKAAQRKAKGDLDDARDAKQEAAGTRADAERLSELTEAKRQARKQG